MLNVAALNVGMSYVFARVACWHFWEVTEAVVVAAAAGPRLAKRE